MIHRSRRNVAKCRPDNGCIERHWSRARAIIVHESTLPEIEKIWDNTPFLKNIIVVGTPKGRALSYESLIAKASEKLAAAKTTKEDIINGLEAGAWLQPTPTYPYNTISPLPPPVSAAGVEPASQTRVRDSVCGNGLRVRR